METLKQGLDKREVDITQSRMKTIQNKAQTIKNAVGTTRTSQTHKAPV